jgi:hypothetical protein
MRFEILFEKKNEESENDNNQEVAFSDDQFKGKCRNCGVIGHKAKDCKSKWRSERRKSQFFSEKYD